MAVTTVMSPAEMREYTARLIRVRDAFNRRGPGSRRDAAFDTRTTASRLSGVLNQREVNVEILDKLDAWITANPTRP